MYIVKDKSTHNVSVGVLFEGVRELNKTTALYVSVFEGVRELNKTTALYVSVSRDLGTSVDCAVLRHQLASIRKRALLLARQNKLNILPHLRGLVY